jgi:hypothetical protein
MSRLGFRLTRLELRQTEGSTLGQKWFRFLAGFRAVADSPGDPCHGATDDAPLTEAEDLAATGQPATFAGLLLSVAEGD